MTIKPQSQQSLKDQLQALCVLGRHAGLYDAVTFITGFMIKQEIIEGKKNANRPANKEKL